MGVSGGLLRAVTLTRRALSHQKQELVRFVAHSLVSSGVSPPFQPIREGEEARRAQTK